MKVKTKKIVIVSVGICFSALVFIFSFWVLGPFGPFVPFVQRRDWVAVLLLFLIILWMTFPFAWIFWPSRKKANG